MCGRLVINLSPETITEIYGIVQKIDRDLNPRYNVAPTLDIPIVRQAADGARELAFTRWGLIPSWAKDTTIGNSLINARAETVAEKPSFRAAYRNRRCIIPATGFYEWQRFPDGSKQTWYIKGHEDQPLSIAGLWEHWKTPEGSELETCTIITTAANELMTPIHDRMPVIMSLDSIGPWLDMAGSPDDVSLLRPCDPDILDAYMVSSLVNNSRFDSPACIARV